MFPERPQLVFLSPERGSIDIDAQLASLQESGFFVTDVCPPQKQKALTFSKYLVILWCVSSSVR